MWKVGARVRARARASAHTRTRTHARARSPPRLVCDGRVVAPSGRGEQMLVNCSAG